MSVRRDDEDYPGERRQSLIDEDRANHDDPAPRQYEEQRCGMRRPDSTTTCTELAGHAGPDGRNESHGDGSVIRWIYR